MSFKYLGIVVGAFLFRVLLSGFESPLASLNRIMALCMEWPGGELAFSKDARHGTNG